MAETLLSCPFCGGETRIDERDYKYPDGAHAMYGYSVRCIGCGARTCEYRTEGGAVDAWNRRAERMCRDVSEEPGQFNCSECRATLYGGDETGFWIDNGDLLYCPSCGARVVSC